MDIVKVEQLTPIEMEWGEEESVGSSDIGKCDSVDGKNRMNQEDSRNSNLSNNGQNSDLMRCDKYTDLENSTSKEVRASERLKRPPTTKNNDFFIVEEKCATGSSELLVYHQNICG
jgi:hypothetical protein